MSRFIEGSTKFCVVGGCSRLATKWSGILLKSRDAVRAGFCDEHFGIPCPNSFKIHNCYGVYNDDLELRSVKHTANKLAAINVIEQ